MAKKVFITGASGYLGKLLLKKLNDSDWVSEIHGVDINDLDLTSLGKVTFTKMSVNDSGLIDLVKEKSPDIMMHFAFIVDPIHDINKLRRVNIEGTKNVLNASVDVPYFMLASSGTAYGAFEDNPIPLTYEHPIRKHPSFEYAANKTAIEELTNAFANQNLDQRISIIRPTVVYGPTVDNYLSGMLSEIAIPSIKGYNPPLQFVHEYDVTESIAHILEKEATGTFNITPKDSMTIKEVIARSGKATVAIPYGIAKFLINLAWNMKLKFQKYPAGFLDYIMYPWVMDNSRLTNELGYVFKYSSEQTLELMIEKLKN